MPKFFKTWLFAQLPKSLETKVLEKLKEEDFANEFKMATIMSANKAHSQAFMKVFVENIEVEVLNFRAAANLADEFDIRMPWIVTGGDRIAFLSQKAIEGYEGHVGFTCVDPDSEKSLNKVAILAKIAKLRNSITTVSEKAT